MITRIEVMDFFRSDEYIEEMNIEDRVEIALLCMAYSEYLYTTLESAIDLDEAKEEQPNG